ncbi:MAG TPA: glycosyltransferase [Candidatus Paceibacterota bacterium]|nr:glycosyltransferase [Candidatus Paceibacterota bacterium]
MITGDRSFKPGHPRYELQRAQVDELEPAYWGRGSLWPRIPGGPFDVVTAQDPFWRGLMALRFARRLRARLQIQVHADLDAVPGWKRSLAKYVISRADSVRVVSEKIKAQVGKSNAGVPIRVLPVYIDIERFRGISREAHEGVVLLWIGRFEAEKDPLQALDVLRQARAAGIDARLIMLGKGSFETELKAHAAGLPVEFPGWQDPARYLGTADLVISTSPYESYGASIVEALAAGVPVVSYDVGVAREAGATIAPKGQLAETAIQALGGGARGELKLRVLSESEWAQAWKGTL